MTVAEDLVLVALDPASGTVRIPSGKADAVLGGAVLLELVTHGRVGVEGTGRKARVVVLDPSPLADPVLETGFARIRQRGRQAPRSVVPRLGRKQRAAVVASLEGAGLVRDRGETFLGFALERLDLLDAARRDDLLTRVRAVLLQDQPADGTSGPLVGLLLAADLLTLVVERPDRRRAKARANVVAEGDWASEGVREAIAAADAVLIAVMAGTVAAGSAGS